MRQSKHCHPRSVLNNATVKHCGTHVLYHSLKEWRGFGLTAIAESRLACIAVAVKLHGLRRHARHAFFRRNEVASFATKGQHELAHNVAANLRFVDPAQRTDGWLLPVHRAAENVVPLLTRNPISHFKCQYHSISH